MTPRWWDWLALMATFCAGALWVGVGMPGLPPDLNPFLNHQNTPVITAVSVPPVAPTPPPPTPTSQIEHRGVAPADLRPPPPPPVAPTAERKTLPDVIRPGGGELPGGEPAGAVIESNLPAVIHPSDPTEPVAEGGSGFFVAHDGSFMTAAHVVRSCQRISIVSRHLQPAVARLLAIDIANDIAVLRAPGVRPPGVLALADQPFGAQTLAVLGYPGDGDLLRATETQGQLRTEHPSFKGLERLNRPDVMWMDANTVRPGFSGGPVLNPSGNVVGLINGQVLRRVGQPGSATRDVKYVYGTSTRLLAAFINQEVPSLVPDADQTLPPADMDKAVVHILCVH